MRKNLTLNGGQFAFDVVFYSILMSLFVEPFDIFIARDRHGSRVKVNFDSDLANLKK